MGKVKDEKAVSKPKPRDNAPGGARKSALVQFVLNLTRSDLYKPMQGWYARLYTAIALGVIAAAGAQRVFEIVKESEPLFRFSAPAAFAGVLAWIIFRLVHYPPFAEFLIATEAEMNKVSWTSKEDLIRATSVVLSTVVLMAFFLFFVDRLWTFILERIGVLQFGGSGGFGSTA